MRIAAATLIVLLLPLLPVRAAEPLEGWFIAREVCEAFQSKNKLTNPGDVATEPDRAYDMIAINKAGGDFFQVRVPGGPVTADRWVHVSCGVHVVEAGTEVSETGPVTPPVTPAPEGNESTENLLALSWQPAFCETRPGKDECLLLNEGGLPFAEGQLSLHGLWPQPRGNDYCGVSAAQKSLDAAGRWVELPEVPMDAETREALDAVMPGSMSFLERHEWIKHGTCFHGQGGADEYFDDTLQIVDEINQSVVGDFLAARVGADIRSADLRAAFDEAFGPGAGARVQVQCNGDGGRVLIQELFIHLRGEIAHGVSVADLLLEADAVTEGCPGGIIDPAGLQ